MAPDQTAPAGHPRGLYPLFLTEMWERFSFYGMRALLVLYMVAEVQRGGMGLTDEVATAIYGLYAAGVYLAALPGGWVGDRVLGAQRTVLLGGCLITVGQFALVVPVVESFHLGLVLLVVGTGLLKPNISTIVGRLYPHGGARQDAGFTIFYMGINIGAAIGPLVCGALRTQYDWHYGFGAAGVGMVLGLLQFVATRKHLGDAGLHPGVPARRRDWWVLAVGLAAIGIVTALVVTGRLAFDPLRLARGAAWLILAVGAGYFACLFLFYDLTAVERKRLAVVVILFLASATFWAGYEQAGSSFNLFAERYTNRGLFSGSWRCEVPAEWFQSINAVFVVVLAPIVAAVWVALARRGRNPSPAAKFGAGLVFLSGGFLVMVVAAWLVAGGGSAGATAGTASAAGAPAVRAVGPTWLVLTYFLHTVAELCLSPVGLSSVTKLSPPRLTGQMMGLWFLATSLGNLLAGLIAGTIRADAVPQMPALFGQLSLGAGLCGLALLLLSRPVRRLMSGVE